MDIVFIDDGITLKADKPAEFFNNPQTQRVRKFLNVFKFEAQ